MPFKSKAQRGFMYENKPKLAKEFEAATPENAQLPEHVKKMAKGGETNPKKETLKAMENNPIAGFADGGEVEEPEHKTMLGEDATLVGLRELMRKHAAGENIHEQPTSDFTVNSSTKNYAGGGEVDPNFLAQLNSGTAMSPDAGTAATPSLGATTAAINSTPDTNYDFYGNVGADQRKALYDQLLQKQTSGGNMLAQAAGGIGDAISNSFGGQHNKFQDTARGIAEQNTANRIGAVDTQRAQKLQDMQGSQEAIMNDPHHPIAEAMRKTLKGFGVNVPSGMNAGIMLKVAGPMGELALKQATVAIQQGQSSESARHNRVDEANTATAHADTAAKQRADVSNAQTARKESAAKGLQERPWYQKGFEAVTPAILNSDATNEMRSELKQPESSTSSAPMTATNSMGHKITSTDGGQTWQ